MSTWAQFGLQDVASPFASELIHFHDFVLVIMAIILVIVVYSLICAVVNTNTNLHLLQGQVVETIWTIVPMFMLILIGYPSLQVLYTLEEVKEVHWTVKVIGHQWYWSYEFGDYYKFMFDSFMVPTNELEEGLPRLLEVDNRLVLPFHQIIRVLVSSSDVIHSWAVPSLGVKMDAVPGRINQLFTFITRPGIYYGQCSEICGANHSFMPIVLEAVSFNDFCSWCVACDSSFNED
uniref:Cytochrome c oxidase subunit 2 n=1 Tax=Chiridota sp. SS-2021 TaxID=2834204 RepID=A0A8E5NM81_9ECHN|nr:cytochrome c oxidase subunit II [Chiridota sp. SS-2021]